MKEGLPRPIIRRKDYTPYPWKLLKLDLDFDIGDPFTTVTSEMQFSLAIPGKSRHEIALDGQELELVSISLDGVILGADEYSLDANRLLVHSAPAECVLKIQVRIRPHDNTALEGLYGSGNFLLTQCEAEGFRKITYFPDRPDVMTRYKVRIEADQEHYPVLLSNGNAIESGSNADGRHWVVWEDPFRKPSYLFALVAGDLAFIEDKFVTRSGRQVLLRVYTEHRNIDKCDYAMQSLVRAMRWDEQRFDLEYDLDIYNIVATDDFNMGAMENKSLNIFNTKYVLARPDTATDYDYQGIEAVIGHEYFHNWTGNRVTCRDWFQLTLKEGLTVFRDQEFSSDMQSRAVKRIRDARELRNRQFPEDAGSMSHPIRPDQYSEINNFYTMTVYQKGAAIIRMYHTLLGEEGFQRGMKLYFERHDGQAVTCDDFLAAMADANDTDLDFFGRWYSQSGTPEVAANGEYDEQRQVFHLHLSQHTPATQDQSEKLPLLIPLAMGLLTPSGESIPLQLEGEAESVGFSRVLRLDQPDQTFEFQNVPVAPIPSLLREFSAPVKLHYDYSASELSVLMQHDPDPYVRWQAAQQLGEIAILENTRRHASGRDMCLDQNLASAFRALLEDRETDPALLAEALHLPAEDYLAELMSVVDVDGIHAARQFTRRALAAQFHELFATNYDRLNDGAAYEMSAVAAARRSLKNTCLSYLVDVPGGEETAHQQFQSCDNMTDSMAALAAMVYADTTNANEALQQFEQRWAGEALVMDKWFALQATRPGSDASQQVEQLRNHPEFSLANPNRVRSLVGAFAFSNPTGFHARDGSGYHWLADRVIELNGINPQVASRMATAFNQLRRYDPERQALMVQALKRIAAVADLSGDVAEIVNNALGHNPV
ncbi:MAG TPA: aminopeptidase N [Xanthomonadales bacterium]|nr:aminopeptidase N [Xanthomonadales bacterium]